MSRISNMLSLLVCAVLMTSLVCCTVIDAGAQEKKDKKDEQKKDKKDEPKKEEKKDEKKEEKKEPFKPDMAQEELKGHTGWIMAVSFGADGKTLASVGREKVAKIWDVKEKKELLSVKGYPTETHALAYMPGQLYVGTGKWNKEKKGWEGEIKDSDAKTGKDVKSLKGHTDEIMYLAVSADGKSMASASKDKTAIIWNLTTGKDTQTVKGHTDGVNSVSFSQDGKLVVTTSADKTVRVWELAGAKEIALFKVEKTVDSTDPKTKKTTQVKELGREFTRAVFSKDGKRIIAGNLDGAIKIYDLDSKKEVKELKAHEGIWALALSPDGSKLATGGYDQTIKLWDVASGKELRTIKAHLGTVTTLSFSPNGQWLASGAASNDDHLVKIWNVK